MSKSSSSHLPDQPIMKYVHPADRLRPWFGIAVGLAALVGMLAFAILDRNFGTLEHLKALNEAGSWLTMSLIEASAEILALLLAAVTLERVMNWIRNGLGMRETEIAKEPSRPWNPHSYAVFAQVHNTL
jgi:hypothetical protein